MTPEQAAIRQIQAMRKSRYFKILEGYFLWRREALLAEELTTEFALAKNRGAVEEIGKFLRHPELMALYLEHTKREPDESADLPAGVDTSWRTSMGLSVPEEGLS